MTTKKHIEECIRDSLEGYFKDLRGVEPTSMYEMILSTESISRNCRLSSGVYSGCLSSSFSTRSSHIFGWALMVCAAMSNHRLKSKPSKLTMRSATPGAAAGFGTGAYTSSEAWVTTSYSRAGLTPQ